MQDSNELGHIENQLSTFGTMFLAEKNQLPVWVAAMFVSGVSSRP